MLPEASLLESTRVPPWASAMARAIGSPSPAPSEGRPEASSYSGELGHPFHVIDDRTVVLPFDHPFVPEGRFASMLVEDAELAQNLATGLGGLWRKAMRDLREIDFHPGARSPAASEGPHLDPIAAKRSRG